MARYRISSWCHHIFRLFWSLNIKEYLKISVQRLFRLFAVFLVYGCLERARQSFESADVVAAIRYLGDDKSDGAYKYEIIKSWKFDLKPGTVIGFPFYGTSCSYYDGVKYDGDIPLETIVIAYFNLLTPSPGYTYTAVISNRCARHLRESDDGYAETIRWLDERVKQPEPIPQLDKRLLPD